MIGEKPFRLHLFTERQIERYIDYCAGAQYSFVHMDATGGVLKSITEQKLSLVYALLFKDGQDSMDNVALAHAILTDHTVPSISYFLGSLSHSITELKGRLIFPSFFVIDFSAALVNSILQVFNGETIQAHLSRCWNVLCGKYSAKELRSYSYIHFCCCHVIHAVARSLTAAHVEKKTRRGILHIFAHLLCANDMKKLYDLFGLIINIFGDPNEENAQEKYEQLLALEFRADERSVSKLTNERKIFKKAKKNAKKLEEVDEYLRSNLPIIHQSPFNEEAHRLYPALANLINSKSNHGGVVNPLFSPSVIRIFYRWWAYLPLWTGLLWYFKERYSNNLQRDLDDVYNPLRQSNASIESYFRTMKRSILRNRVSNRPSDIIVELYRSVQVQSKANTFNVSQSSKGRKRKKRIAIVEEKWGKKKTGPNRRSIYFNAIDKCATKQARSKVNESQHRDTSHVAR